MARAKRQEKPSPKKSTDYAASYDAPKPEVKDTVKSSSTGKGKNLEDYIDDIQTAITYVKTNYHPFWRKYYRLYKNRRVKIGYEGYSDAFVPETFTIIESLVANIAGGKPKFTFLPTNEEQRQNVDVLNHLINYIWEANGMDQKSQVWVREMLQYGTAVLYVGWDADKNMPVIRNIPIYDFIFDPTATNLANAGYVGYRYLANRSDLADMKTVDPETGKTKPMYDLSRLPNVTGGKTGEQMDKEIKDILQGSTVPSKAYTSQVEVICLYYKDGTKVEIANRSAIISEGDSPFQKPETKVTVDVIVDGQPQHVERTSPEIKPFYPFALLRDYIDESLFLGSGEIEVIMDRQETLNDVENMDIDNAAYANNIMWQIDPQFADLMPEISAAPGLVIPIPQNALQPIQRPQSTADLENKMVEIKEEMRRATAADEVIQGASQDQGRVTATEVNTQLAQSHMRFSTKLNNLEAEGYKQLADILIKVCQIFIDQKVAIRMVGEDGIEWGDFDPNEFTGEYEPQVELDTTVKQQQLEVGQKLNQMYNLMLNNFHVNQTEALRFIFTNLGAQKEEVDRLLDVPPGNIPVPRPKVDVRLTGQIPTNETLALAQSANPNGGVQPGGPSPLQAAQGSSLLSGMSAQATQPLDMNGLNPAPLPTNGSYGLVAN